MTDFPPIPESEEIEQAVLDAALGLEREETRLAFLHQVFGDHPDKVGELVDLINASRQGTGMLLEAGEAKAELARSIVGPGVGYAQPGHHVTADDGDDARVGPYVLVKKLGEGTYGEVFEARGTGLLQRRVAIKIIRRGMDTEAVIARFAIERQALAIMDHPNIARVMDAGSTPRGRPYFVMDLAGPERLTAYCDGRELGLSQRLELFLQVCSAIQHAHQKGIIHRDIKPSNVLVSEVGGKLVPKVIDFGVAKATCNAVRRGANLTASDEFIGTPAYMSPEQVEFMGTDVDTRADIYGLGALLYELLSGHPPFDPETLVGGGAAAMRKAILFEAPPRLSVAVMEARGASSPGMGRHKLALRGTLDWIVAKAMEKDRKRRYQSVGALVEDIERYQNHKPVRARRPSRFYVLGCFIRRNRAACVSAAAAILTLAVSAAVTGRLYLLERAASGRERAALGEQVRLREIAEKSAEAALAARNEESSQRERAEAALAEQRRLADEARSRETMSLAAILATVGKGDSADRLLRSSQPARGKLSKEASLLIRTVGSRYALEENWAEASRCFSLLIHAGLFLPGLDGKEPHSLDLLLPGPAMLEAGDRPGYEAFRTEIVRRWAVLPGAGSVAERLLKASGLCPAPPEVIESLRPMAGRLEAQLERGESTYDLAIPWGAFAMALYGYRSGDLPMVARWAEISWRDGKTLTPDRAAALHCLVSMSLMDTGDAEGARRELDRAAGLFDSGKVVPSAKGMYSPPSEPTWWDCAMARCLYREAKERIARQ